jgi:hypothetical protein
MEGSASALAEVESVDATRDSWMLRPEQVQRASAPARSASGRLFAMLFFGSVAAIYMLIAYALYTLIVAVA